MVNKMKKALCSFCMMDEIIRVHGYSFVVVSDIVTIVLFEMQHFLPVSNLGFTSCFCCLSACRWLCVCDAPISFDLMLEARAENADAECCMEGCKEERRSRGTRQQVRDDWWQEEKRAERAERADSTIRRWLCLPSPQSTHSHCFYSITNSLTLV